MIEIIRASGSLPLRSRLAKANGHWGPWVLDRKTLTITCEDYEIDPERIDTSGEMLDFIMQIARKSWATDEVLANLVRALNDIIEPQAYLCSGGSQKKIKNTLTFLRSRISDKDA